MTGTPEQIVDELTYRCYVHNRRSCPEITASEWAKCWPGADKLEAKYKTELALRKAAA